MRDSPACTGAARCTSAQPRGPGTVRSSLLTKMVMILYIVVSLILFVNVLFRNDDGKEWPGVRQQERPVAGLLGGQLRRGRDCHGRELLSILSELSCLIIISTFQACAPRYIYYVFMNRRDPVGVCHIARNNFTEFRHFRPCVDEGSMSLKF